MENKKPSFREVGETIILDDVGLIFNPRRVGLMSFWQLRKADYGKGFRMPTMPELSNLIYACFENKNYETAKRIIETREWIAGNTVILQIKNKGMYVQDNPKLNKYGNILKNEKTLLRKLGWKELGEGPSKERVTFSDDKTIRFAPYYAIGEQSPLSLSKNLGLIALVNGEENAGKIAKVSEHFKLNPYFMIPKHDEYDSSALTFAGLDFEAYGRYLTIGGTHPMNFGHRSFGVKKLK